MIIQIKFKNNLQTMIEVSLKEEYNIDITFVKDESYEQAYRLFT